MEPVKLIEKFQMLRGNVKCVEGVLLFECSLHKGNISSLPCSTKEHQCESLDLKPRQFVRRGENIFFFALDCSIQFIEMPKNVSQVHEFHSPWHICRILSYQKHSEFFLICTVGPKSAAISSDVLLPFPHIESKTDKSFFFKQNVYLYSCTFVLYTAALSGNKGPFRVQQTYIKIISHGIMCIHTGVLATLLT